MCNSMLKKKGNHATCNAQIKSDVTFVMKVPECWKKRVNVGTLLCPGKCSLKQSWLYSDLAKEGVNFKNGIKPVQKCKYRKKPKLAHKRKKKCQ